MRELLSTDSSALFITFNDEVNYRFTLFEPHKTIDETHDWLEKMNHNPFWVISSPDNTAIGFVVYHSINEVINECRIGFHLNKNYWDQGLVPAVVIFADNFIFNNTDISCIAATVKPENTQSQRCLEKSGYLFGRIIDDYISSVENDKSKVRYLYSKCKSNNIKLEN